MKKTNYNKLLHLYFSMPLAERRLISQVCKIIGLSILKTLFESQYYVFVLNRFYMFKCLGVCS